LLFEGTVTIEEMTNWVAESKKTLPATKGSFGIMVDMRELRPLLPEVQKKMEEGQKLFAEKGMQKSVVILNSAVLTMQFKRIAKETGIYAFERYLDATKVSNFEQVGTDWLTKGIDPDL
jgi:hypothetical protein